MQHKKGFELLGSLQRTLCIWLTSDHTYGYTYSVYSSWKLNGLMEIYTPKPPFNPPLYQIGIFFNNTTFCTSLASCRKYQVLFEKYTNFGIFFQGWQVRTSCTQRTFSPSSQIDKKDTHNTRLDPLPPLMNKSLVVWSKKSF